MFTGGIAKESAANILSDPSVSVISRRTGGSPGNPLASQGSIDDRQSLFYRRITRFLLLPSVPQLQNDHSTADAIATEEEYQNPAIGEDMHHVTMEQPALQIIPFWPNIQTAPDRWMNPFRSSWAY